jgi:hypothetical protein
MSTCNLKRDEEGWEGEADVGVDGVVREGEMGERGWEGSDERVGWEHCTRVCSSIAAPFSLNVQSCKLRQVLKCVVYIYERAME